MQTAADAAALAGARAVALEQGDGAVNSAVQTYATDNGADTVSWQYTADEKGVDVTVSKDYDTYFARVLGYDELTAGNNSSAAYGPVIEVPELVPLAINGCDCLTFEEFPVEIGEDDFGEIVTAIYRIGNANDQSVDFVFNLQGLDTTYSPTPANRPYYMFYDPDNNGIHTVYGDGTAKSVERIINSNGEGFIVDLTFSGRTSTPPGGSPHCGGVCPDTTEWYYYTDVEGSLIGMPGTRYEGALIEVTYQTRAAQVGPNAHIYNPRPYMGASAWIQLDVVNQPLTGVVFNTRVDNAVNHMLLLPTDGSGDPPTPTAAPTATPDGGGDPPTATPVPPTATPTDTPTNTPTHTPTDTPTNTPVPTSTPTNTSTPVPPTATSTNTPASQQAVVSFTLVNANTNQDIGPLADGDVIVLNDLPTQNLNVRANTNPATVGSVRFTLNGSNHTENARPYAMKGDSGGNYNNWTPSIGQYTLTAVPYTQGGANGNAGASLSITFSVTDQVAPPTPNAGTCLVDYDITNSWSNGFRAEVTITNQTNVAYNGWQIDWDFANNQWIYQYWSGNVKQTQKHVRVKNYGWNRVVNPGASVTFGFLAWYSGSNQVPTNFIVNGLTCSTATASRTSTGEAVASIPLPAANSFSALSLDQRVAPVATVAALSMERVSLAAAPLSASAMTVSTVESMGSLMVAPLSDAPVQHSAISAAPEAVRAAAAESVAAVASYCPSNMLLNGSFEQLSSGKPRDWKGYARTGNHGYTIPDGNLYGYNAAGQPPMYQDVNVVAGGTYDMSFYSSSHLPGVQKVKMQYFDASNNPVGTAAVHTISVDIDDPGNVFGGPYNLSLGAAPANAAKLRVTIDANGRDWAKVDALCLEGNEPAPTATPTNTSAPTATPTSSGGMCPASIDFETDASGSPLVKGQIIDNEWSANGVHITTNNPGSRPAMIFTSGSPTGGDNDLGAPNQGFGGPGHGAGGGPGYPGANNQSHGNILIISEDGDSNDPDDNAGGGTIIFTFDNPVNIDQVSILDVDDEEAGGTVTAFSDSAGNNPLVEVDVLGLGDNSYQILPIGATGARRMEIQLPASGGIPHVTFCETVAPAIYELGDKIWRDLNGNGVQDNGEPGVSDVDLELFVTGLPQVVYSTSTDSNGEYRFSNLPAGNYTVKIVNSNFSGSGPLNGWLSSPLNAGGDDTKDSDFGQSTREATASVPLSGGDNLTVDGGFIPPDAPTATPTKTPTPMLQPTSTPTSSSDPGPEVEFCVGTLKVAVGETFQIRDYVRHADNGLAGQSVDWAKVYFTYTDAGANNPTTPPNWHLNDFNSGIPVTTTSADRANGTGNEGKGKYRLYIVRNGQSSYDDYMTIRVTNSNSTVDSAKCAPSTPTPTPTKTPTSNATHTPTWTPTPTPIQACVDNRLLNASFEQTSSGVPLYWNGYARTGNHGYTIPDGTKYGYNAANQPVMYQDVDVIPDGTYDMSFYSASQLPGVQQVRMQYLDASNSPIGTPAVHTISVDIDDPGNNFGGPYTLSLGAAPANAVKLRVSVDANGRDWAKVDAFCLEADEPEVTPTATPTQTATPTSTSTTAPPPSACQLYPIALSAQTIEGATPGTSLGDIYNGAQPGNFGWLTWVGAPNVPTLVTSLTPPGDSYTYVNPNNASDRVVSIGDWIQGSPGVSNASEVRSALDTLKTIDITVPVWDLASGTGNNSLYRVVNFAIVRITDYRLPSQNRITATFKGYDLECGALVPTATPTATPTETPTITPTPTATEWQPPLPTPTPSSGSCALDDAASNMNRYSLIVLDDLSTNSDVENRAFIGGSLISSASANFAINASGIAPTDASLVIVGDLAAGNAIQLNAGSLRLGGNSNGRTINFNGGGSLIPDNSLSDGPITTLLQDASAQLAAEAANNTATLPSGQPGPARFNVSSVTEKGVAIFEVAAADLFGNNNVQQIELNPGSASLVVINVTGSTVNWSGNGNMVGNFTNSQWRSRVIWNFAGASTINFGSRNMMGAVLAPYAHVTTSANIDGSVAVRALTTTSEIHQPTFSGNLGNLCDDDPTDPPNQEAKCQLAWLDWDGGSSSNSELADNLANPARSGSHQVGDRIPAGPNVENVREVTDALDNWIDKTMTVVFYDDGDQQNGYQVCGFAQLTLWDYDFDSVPKWLSGQFTVGTRRGVIDKDAEDYGLRGVYFK